MSDFTQTAALVNISFLNMGSLYINNVFIGNHSFVQSDGNFLSSWKSYKSSLPRESVKVIDLFFLPTIDQFYLYNQLELDKTAIDVTITNIDSTMIDLLNDQVDNTNIKFRALQLNNYEFIITVFINQDNISDVDITFNPQTDNQFISDYQMTKLKLNDQSIAQKFYHKFR